jgi:hypothetical protein
MLMVVMMSTYFLCVGVGTFVMGVAADRSVEIEHAIAVSEPKFVVTCVDGKAARLSRRVPGSGGCCASGPTMCSMPV